MALLKEFRDRPGTRLTTTHGQNVMVLELCPGMIREGVSPFGAKEGRVTLVDMDTGRTFFEFDDEQVTEVMVVTTKYRDGDHFSGEHGN